MRHWRHAGHCEPNLENKRLVQLASVSSQGSLSVNLPRCPAACPTVRGACCPAGCLRPEATGNQGDTYKEALAWQVGLRKVESAISQSSSCPNPKKGDSAPLIDRRLASVKSFLKRLRSSPTLQKMVGPTALFRGCLEALNGLSSKRMCCFLHLKKTLRP